MQKNTATSEGGGRRRSERGATLSPAEVLHQAVGDGGSKIYTVTLDNIAAAVGPDWERLRTKIELITDSVVKRHFRRGSLTTTMSGDSYVVMLVGPDSDDGRRRVVKLADDLSHHLIGGRVIRRDKTKIVIGRLSPKELMGSDGKLRPYQDVVEKVEIIAAPPPEPLLPGENTTDGNTEPKLTDVAHGRGKALEANWSPIDSSEWKMPDSVLPESDLPPPPPMLMVTSTFRPAWNAITGSVDTHYCQPGVRQGRTIYSEKDAIAALGGATAWLDYEIITATMATLTNLGVAGDIGTLVLPLHFGSLRDADSRRVLSALGGCAKIVGYGNLLIDIVSVPFTLPLESVTHALAPLEPHGVSVLLRMDLYDPHFQLLEAFEPAGITVDLSTMTDWQRQPDRFFRALARFRLGSRNQSMFLWGASRRDEALAAIGAGFTVVDCRAALPDRDIPKRPEQMPLSVFRREPKRNEKHEGA